MTDLYSIGFYDNTSDDTVYYSDYSDDDYTNSDSDDDKSLAINPFKGGRNSQTDVTSQPSLLTRKSNGFQKIKKKTTPQKTKGRFPPQKTKVEQPINEIMREYSPNRCYQNSAQIPSFIKDINRLELPSKVINKASELYYENGMPKNRKDCRRKMMAHFLISAAHEVNIKISPTEIYKMCGLKGVVQGNNKFPSPLCIIENPQNYIDDQCLILQLSDDHIEKIKAILNDLTKYKYLKDD